MRGASTRVTGSLLRLYASTYPADVAGMVLVEAGADNPWRMSPDRKLVRGMQYQTFPSRIRVWAP